MDRSFLSDSKLIEASRDFVCIRLATYESKEEAEILKSIFIGRSGELENTTFALLTPKGEKIGRAGRTPDHLYQDAQDLVDQMKKISARYPEKKDAARALPIMKNVRLALDVAACDGRPCAVVVGKSADDLAKLEKRVARAAWTESLEGRIVYAAVTDSKELAPITSLSRTKGVFVVQPDAYGVKGSGLAEVDGSASDKDIEDCLARGVAGFSYKEKDPRTHIREGHRLGIDWKTEIPDTDPGPPGGGGPPGFGPPPGGGR